MKKPTPIEMAELYSQCKAIPELGDLAKRLCFHYEQSQKQIQAKDAEIKSLRAFVKRFTYLECSCENTYIRDCPSCKARIILRPKE